MKFCGVKECFHEFAFQKFLQKFLTKSFLKPYDHGQATAWGLMKNLNIFDTSPFRLLEQLSANRHELIAKIRLQGPQYPKAGQ